MERKRYKAFHDLATGENWFDGKVSPIAPEKSEGSAAQS